MSEPAADASTEPLADGAVRVRRALISVSDKTGVADFARAPLPFPTAYAVAELNKGGGGKIEIVAELPCGGQRDRGYKAMEDMLQAHADLAAAIARIGLRRQLTSRLDQPLLQRLHRFPRLEGGDFSIVR